MILISKDEAMALRDRFPDTNIVRTMRQRSKRHRYYCEESKNIMRFLNALRRGEQPLSVGEGAYDTDRKKNKRIGA